MPIVLVFRDLTNVVNVSEDIRMLKWA